MASFYKVALVNIKNFGQQKTKRKSWKTIPSLCSTLHYFQKRNLDKHSNPRQKESLKTWVYQLKVVSVNLHLTQIKSPIQ